MLEYLNEMMDREDNIEEILGVDPRSRIVNLDKAKSDPFFSPHIHIFKLSTSMELLKKIDATALTTPQKLLVYTYYDHEIIQYEEILRVAQTLNSVERGDWIKVFKEEFVRAVGFNVKKIRSPHHTQEQEDFNIMYLFDHLQREGLNDSLYELIRLNHFLVDGQNDESFDEFYEEESEEEASELYYSYMLSELLNVFRGRYLGSLGSGITEEVKRKLKTLPKSLYMKVLMMNTRVSMMSSSYNYDVVGKKIETLDVFLEMHDEALPRKIRTFRESQDIFLKEVVEKARKTEKLALIVEILMALFYEEYMDGEDSLWIHDKRMNDLTELILENEELNLKQLLSLRLSFKNPSLWITHSDSEDIYELFFRLLSKDFIRAVEIFEFMVHENHSFPPSYSEWLDEYEDLFKLPLPSALQLLSRSKDRLRVSGEAAMLRELDEAGELDFRNESTSESLIDETLISDFYKSLNILMREVLKKVEVEGVSNILYHLSNLNRGQEEKEHFRAWFHELTELIRERRDLLTLRDIFSLLLSFKHPDLWIGGDGEDVYTLYFSLLEMNFQSAVKFFEYMTFENIHMAPTYSEWSSFSDELFNLPPVLLLDFISPERGVNEFRESFYPKLLKDLRRDDEELFEKSLIE